MRTFLIVLLTAALISAQKTETFGNKDKASLILTIQKCCCWEIVASAAETIRKESVKKYGEEIYVVVNHDKEPPTHNLEVRMYEVGKPEEGIWVW